MRDIATGARGLANALDKYEILLRNTQMSGIPNECVTAMIDVQNDRPYSMYVQIKSGDEEKVFDDVIDTGFWIAAESHRIFRFPAPLNELGSLGNYKKALWLLPKKALLGDVNLDGTVDATDTLEIAAFYQKKGPTILDIDGSGIVDKADMALLAPNMGKSLDVMSTGDIRSTVSKIVFNMTATQVQVGPTSQTATQPALRTINKPTYNIR